jgi:membrane protease YdiL (CAAX protease family)
VFWPGFAMYLVASMCGVAAVQRWRHARISPWEGMGLRLDRRVWADVGGGVAISALLMGGIFCVEWALGMLRVHGVQPPNLCWMVRLPVLAFLAFVEEAVYRSLMLKGLLVLLRKRWLALIVMAAVFGLAHAGNPNASALSVLGNVVDGLIYGVAFLGSGRIWLPWGLHFAWNFFQGPVLGFPVSGLDMGGWVQQTPVGNALLTGGSYGPEAGLIAMAFRVVAIALLAGWLSRRPKGRSSDGRAAHS